MALTKAQQERRKQLQEEVAQAQKELDEMGTMRIEPTRARLIHRINLLGRRIAAIGRGEDESSVPDTPVTFNG